MTEKSFCDEAEMREWIEQMYEESADPAHPPKIFKAKDGHLNWMLDQRWLVKEKGMEVKNETKLQENLDRKGETMAGSLQLMNIDTDMGKVKSAQERHKQATSKITGGLRRLAANISTAEGNLPGLKRRLPEAEHLSIKKGLNLVRAHKEDFMDKYEDLKDIPEEAYLEATLAEMHALTKEINLDIQSLQDLCKKHSHPKMIKDESKPTESQSEAGEGRSIRKNNSPPRPLIQILVIWL